MSPSPGIQRYHQCRVWTPPTSSSFFSGWSREPDWRMGPWRTAPPRRTPGFPGQTLTRAFSEMLLLGPFHWIITLPRSSRKMSSLLKLSQDSCTCQSQEGGRETGCQTSSP